MAQPDKSKGNEVPLYRATAKCYIDDILYDPDAQPLVPAAEVDGEPTLKPLYVRYAGIPGPHLEPVNDAAKAMAEKHKDRMQLVDPITQLHVVGHTQASTGNPVEDAIRNLAAALKAA